MAATTPYDAADAVSTLDTAATNIRAARKRARDSDARQVAAVLDAAVEDVQARRRAIQAAMTAVSFSAAHAVDVLVAAGVPARLDDVEEVAEVRLGDTRLLRIRALAAATGAADAGYMIDVVEGGVVILTLHADTDADLTTLAAALRAAS